VMRWAKCPSTFSVKPGSISGTKMAIGMRHSQAASAVGTPTQPPVRKTACGRQRPHSIKACTKPSAKRPKLTRACKGGTPCKGPACTVCRDSNCVAVAAISSRSKAWPLPIKASRVCGDWLRIALATANAGYMPPPVPPAEMKIKVRLLWRRFRPRFRHRRGGGADGLGRRIFYAE